MSFSGLSFSLACSSVSVTAHQSVNNIYAEKN